MEDVGLIICPFGIIYGNLVPTLCGNWIYFMAIWYILWQFGIFYGYIVYFSRFGMLCQ
jgi:hypothetical protein